MMTITLSFVVRHIIAVCYKIILALDRIWEGHNRDVYIFCLHQNDPLSKKGGRAASSSSAAASNNSYGRESCSTSRLFPLGMPLE